MIGVLYIMAGVVAGALIAVVTFATLAYVSKRNEGKQDSRCVELVVRLELAQANVFKQSNRADVAERKVGRLNATIAKISARAVGHERGAFAELLQAIAEEPGAGTSDGGGGALLSDGGDPGAETGARSGEGDSDLLPPGG